MWFSGRSQWGEGFRRGGFGFEQNQVDLFSCLKPHGLSRDLQVFCWAPTAWRRSKLLLLFCLSSISDPPQPGSVHEPSEERVGQSSADTSSCVSSHLSAAKVFGELRPDPVRVRPHRSRLGVFIRALSGTDAGFDLSHLLSTVCLRGAESLWTLWIKSPVSFSSPPTC